MSCQTNANRTTGAAIKCGIGQLAGKAGYATGVAAGAVAGGAMGSLLGPLGTAGGALVGGSVAAGMMNKRQAIKADQARETAWQQSAAGRKAVTARDRALAEAQQQYNAMAVKFQVRLDNAEAQYKAVQTAGVAKLKQEQGLGAAKNIKGALASPEAKAAASSAAQGALALGGVMLANVSRVQLSGGRIGGVKPGAVAAAAGLEGVRQAGRYGKRLKDAYTAAWEQSPEGQAARQKYQAIKRQAETRLAEIKRNHRLGQEAIKSKYDLARAEFLREQA